MSVRFQITLPDDLAVDLKREASREKLPPARFIRQTIESRLRQRASRPEADPFASITNLVDAPDTRLSEKVDDILYR